MVKTSKFGALADFRQQSEAILEPIVEAPIPASPPQPAIEVPKRRVRPIGKRSDPAWKLYSHFLKRKTQHSAALILAERDDGTDLSDVLEDLLQQWIGEQKGA